MRWIAGRWSSGAHQGLGLNASGSRCKMASGDVNPVVGLITPLGLVGSCTAVPTQFWDEATTLCRHRNTEIP